jgi:hypothetical protein
MYALMIPFILYNAIMLCKNAGLRFSISSTIWTSRWTMMSKNAGGKYISSSFMMVSISSYSLPSFFMLIDFRVMKSKK